DPAARIRDRLSVHRRVQQGQCDTYAGGHTDTFELRNRIASDDLYRHVGHLDDAIDHRDFDHARGGGLARGPRHYAVHVQPPRHAVYGRRLLAQLDVDRVGHAGSLQELACRLEGLVRFVTMKGGARPPAHELGDVLRQRRAHVQHVYLDGMP